MAPVPASVTQFLTLPTTKKQITRFCYYYCVALISYMRMRKKKKTFKAIEEKQQKTENSSLLIRQQKPIPQEI